MINAATGDINLVTSTPGTYTITYSFTSGACSNTATTSITITALPTATISYAGTPYCATGTATITQTGTAGGTYTAPAGVVINAATGDIDLATSTPGTYTITYIFRNGTCSNTATTSITINALPIATIAYGGSPYCTTGTATVTKPEQQVEHILHRRRIINAATGDINLTTSTPGTYTITYTFTNGACSNQQQQVLPSPHYQPQRYLMQAILIAQPELRLYTVRYSRWNIRCSCWCGINAATGELIWRQVHLELTQ